MNDTNNTATTTDETANLVELMQSMGYSAEEIAAKLVELDTKARRPIRSKFRRTIYRRCACGETAHAFVASNTYACRNCRNVRTVTPRKG